MGADESLDVLLYRDVSHRPMRLAVVSLALLLTTIAKAGDHFDIVVYGGTSGGVIAAVQAARMGKRVVLIKPTPHIGGVTSRGFGRHGHGRRKRHRRPSTTDQSMNNAGASLKCAPSVLACSQVSLRSPLRIFEPIVG